MFNCSFFEICLAWICPPDFCRRVPQPPVFSSSPLTRLALLSLSNKDFLFKMDRQESHTLRCFFRSGSLATAMVWPWMGSFSLWLWKSYPKLQIRRESGQPVSWVSWLGSRVSYCRAGIATAWGSPRKLNRVVLIGYIRSDAHCLRIEISWRLNNIKTIEDEHQLRKDGLKVGGGGWNGPVSYRLPVLGQLPSIGRRLCN